MNYLKSIRSAGFFILFVLSCSMLTLHALGRDSQAAPGRELQALSVPEQVETWRERIRVGGGAEAYEEFALFESLIPTDDQHTYAHYFGRALYEELGLDGVGVCDLRFQFGCLHEYFGHIIAEYGLNILPTVAKLCEKQVGKQHPCQHGMGHGILASLGYNDVRTLSQALDVCASLYSDDPINGCMGGVFMEFNLYQSLGSTVEPRDPIKYGWHSPCSALDEKYQQSCAWWLPQWWHEHMRITERLEGKGQQIFSRMGELCRDLPEKKYIRDCFQQIGQLTIWDADFDQTKMKGLCDSASNTSAELLLCSSYAGYMVNYYKSDESLALGMCEAFEGKNYSFCMQYATMKSYTPHDIPLP